MRILIAAVCACCSLGPTLIFANDAPELSVPAQAVDLGQTLEFTVAPVDPQGVVPSVYLSTGPSDSKLIDNGDGTRNFEWMADSPGIHELEFTVVDGQDKSVQTTVSSIVAVNETPLAAQQFAQQGLVAKDEYSALGRNLPEFGQPYAETVANSVVTRISGSENFGQGVGDVSHQYSKRRAWNADESLIEIGEKIIDANTLEPVVENIPVRSERVWSHINPDRMFGFTGQSGKVNRLVSFDISSGEVRLIYEFSQFHSCSIGDWEGDISNDDRYLLATCRNSSGGGGKALSLDMVNQKIIGTLDLPNNFNWGGFSHSGQYVLIENNLGFQGDLSLTRYSPSLQNPQVITQSPYHGDFGVDANGDDVYAMVNGNGIHYVVLNTGEVVQLGNAGESGWQNAHLSCRNSHLTGSCFYSKVDGDGLGKVNISAHSPKFQAWGLSRSQGGGYLSQPRASVSPSGTQLVFASNWYQSSAVNAYVIRHLGD